MGEIWGSYRGEGIKMSKLVSVIIPVYNGEKYIRDAIESVLNQTYKNFEIVVADDGSTDNTVEILKEYGDKIRWKSQENKGPASAKKFGTSMAKGEYLAYLDSDDIFLPDKLELQVNYLDKHSEVGLVYSDYYQVNEKGEITKLSCSKKNLLLIQQNYVPTSGVMCRRECIDTLGRFDENLGSNYDWDMWIRISEKYPIHCIPKPLFKYRGHGENISLTRPNRLDYERKVKILLLEKAYQRRGKPSWLKFKIIRAKIERKIGKTWPLSDERLSGFWWGVDRAIDKIERWIFRI